MTRDQAWKKIRKLLGPKAAIDMIPMLTSPERRQQASDQIKFLKTRREELDAKIVARQKELLDVPDFQAMLTERGKMREQVTELHAEATGYRFSAGTLDDTIPGFPIFRVRGRGDTWEEVIAEIEQKKRG